MNQTETVQQQQTTAVTDNVRQSLFEKAQRVVQGLREFHEKEFSFDLADKDFYNLHMRSELELISAHNDGEQPGQEIIRFDGEWIDYLYYSSYGPLRGRLYELMNKEFGPAGEFWDWATHFALTVYAPEQQQEAAQ